MNIEEEYFNYVLTKVKERFPDYLVYRNHNYLNDCISVNVSLDHKIYNELYELCKSFGNNNHWKIIENMKLGSRLVLYSLINNNIEIDAKVFYRNEHLKELL